MNGDILTKCNYSELYSFGSRINTDLTVSIKEFVTPFRFGDIKYSMDSLINDMISAKRKIAKYQIKEYWLDIGVVEDYTQVQEAYNDHFKEKR